MGDSTVTIEVTLFRETEKALLVGASKEDAVWIPRSQIVTTDLEDIGDEGFVEIPEWLAMDKDLEPDDQDWIND